LRQGHRIAGVGQRDDVGQTRLGQPVVLGLERYDPDRARRARRPRRGQ